MNSIRALMSGLIDYAGLFPPAGLEMRAALENYAEYLRSDEAESLGRFIVPIERLEELASAVARMDAPPTLTNPWRLSVLLGAANDSVDFEAHHETAARPTIGLRIDAVESVATTAQEISIPASVMAISTPLFVEIPLDESIEINIAAAAAAGAHAKIRTGGVTPDSIPDSVRVLRFLRACHEAGVAFKATAGLHHPLRAAYALTYEPGSQSAEMFGFLNVFLAAALIRAGHADETVHSMLEETDPSAIQFTEDSITWRTRRLTTGQLRDTRKLFALSFGSCSFREPVDELGEMIARQAVA